MKSINDFINEGFRINKNTVVNAVQNKIDMKKLKKFSKEDINKIIKWVNNDIDYDIRPVVITNTRKNVSWDDPSSQIFLFYTEDYDKSNGFDIPYIRFVWDDKGLSVTIYDDQDTKYYNSQNFTSDKDLDKCFDYIESKYNLIKKLIK